MEVASPARLYAAAVGALLLVLGIFGFFYSASFGAPGTVEDAIGVLEVNGWLNLLHVLAGALGLLAASYAARPFALACRPALHRARDLGLRARRRRRDPRLPPRRQRATNVLHLALGLLGLAAAAGTPHPTSASRGSFGPSRATKEPRDREKRALEAGADAAGEGA